MDSVSETYKLLGTLVFTTAICRPLFEGAKTGAYKEGISHVIPLLFGILPCIDANDFSKSSAALRLIMAYATIVPFRDSSMECNQFEDLTSVMKYFYVFFRFIRLIITKIGNFDFFF